MNPLWFVLAIVILVGVHELGHFTVARACGVKILRFSIGFGPRMASWVSKQSGTEYVLGWLPFGGYVKMLDEREGVVLPQERHRAFNVQPLKVRAAVVMAGPLANLLFAIVLYSGVNWHGVEQAQAVLAQPTTGSAAEAAGFVGGERILRAGFEDGALEEIASFEDFRWWLTRGALAHRNIQAEFVRSQSSAQGPSTVAVLKLETIDARNADASMFRAIGVMGPWSQARLGALVPNGAAQLAGLQAEDVVLRVDQTDIADAGQLRELIRRFAQSGGSKPQSWLIERGGAQVTIDVTPKLEKEGDLFVGRVGAMIGAPPARVDVRYGVWDGFTLALSRTWDVSALTLKMMGKIVTGDASLKNLSGPLTIADFAGKSAALGATQFAVFLALISISLGVLNLLPIPVLDGGHLMYYLWESLTGRPVTQGWADRLQKVGLVVLMMMMSVAVFNDLARFLG